MERNLRKDYFWNTLGTAFFAINSLLYLIIVTRINGLTIAGYFSYSYILANIFNIVILYGGRTYQVSDTNKKFDSGTYVAHRMFLSIGILIFSFIFFFILNYNVEKYWIMQILIAIKCLEGISDSFYGIMQNNNNLRLAGKLLFLKNLFSIILFFVIEYFLKDVILALLILLVLNLIFTFLFDYKFSKMVEKYYIKFSNKLYSMFKYCFPYFILIFLSSLITNIPRYYVDGFLSPDYQGIYGIIIMPVTALLLVLTFIIQPKILPISNYYKSNKKQFYKEVKKIMYICSIFAILFIVLGEFFGIKILTIIYGINLFDQKINFLFILVSGYFYSIVSILINVFTIMRKGKEQVIIYIFSMLTSVVLGYFMVKSMGFNGAVLCYFFINLILLILYIIFYYKEKGKNEK